MTSRELNLDRVSLDGFAVRRLSAILHRAGARHRGVPEGAWWVSLACEPIPDRYAPGRPPVALRASTVSGREIGAAVRIIERRDDRYGTQLVLRGLAPLPDETRW